MADEVMEQQDATTPESNDGTQIPKFKSAEDRDAAYLALEKKSHETAQELAEMKRRMEDFQASQAMQPAEPKEFTDVYKSNEELKKFWDRFAQKPHEVFGEWAQQTLSAFEQRQSIKDAARDAITDFKQKHPDLAPYEDIVSIYVQRQPANLSAREKLERAAPEARKMITQIAQKSPAPAHQLDASTYVEAPSGNRQGVPTVAAPVAKTEEDALSEYLKERSDYRAGKR